MQCLCKHACLLSTSCLSDFYGFSFDFNKPFAACDKSLLQRNSINCGFPANGPSRPEAKESLPCSERLSKSLLPGKITGGFDYKGLGPVAAGEGAERPQPKVEHSWDWNGSFLQSFTRLVHLDPGSTRCNRAVLRLRHLQQSGENQGWSLAHSNKVVRVLDGFAICPFPIW